MPVRSVDDDVLHGLYDEARGWLGEGVEWFDAHTHIGRNDPDGYAAEPEELIAALDDAGQQRALVFAMHEPDGYPAANDRVLEACAASGGRLAALARVDPTADGALEEARRCLAAGARGFKLHPRSDDFACDHPVVGDVVALAAEHRAPVLFHAGRGIPQLGEHVSALACAHPDARIILAHAGISDLGIVGPASRSLPNLLFDTSWWQVSDLLALFTTVAPGQILYATDMPYGPPRFAAVAMARCARAVGLEPAVVREMAGPQLERVLEGEELAELGPAPGPDGLGERSVALERVVSYLTSGVQMTFRGGDPTEAIELARLGCQVPDEHASAALLREVDGLIARSQENTRAHQDPFAGVLAALIAQILAGTPSAV